MRKVRIYQTIVLMFSLLIAVAGNIALGYFTYKTYNDNRALSKQIADKHKLIAEESERIDFYNKHGTSIQNELMRYEGVALTTPNIDKASTSLANMSRTERLQELKRRHAERTAKPGTKPTLQGKRPTRTPTAKAANTQSISVKPTIGTPLTINAPAYLGKVTITPIEYTSGIYTLSLNSEIEYIRFLEWYKYFFSQYPFTVPELVEIKVHDKNIFGSIPTNITVTATLKLISK